MNMINFAREFDARLADGDMAAEGRIFKTANGYLLGWGETLPTGDDESAYTDGAMFIKTNGADIDNIWYVKVSGTFQAASLSDGA